MFIKYLEEPQNNKEMSTEMVYTSDSQYYWQMKSMDVRAKTKKKGCQRDNCWLLIYSLFTRCKTILKGSDDGIKYSELLDFLTLPIIWNSKKQKTQCFRNCISFCPKVSGGRHLICWIPNKDSGHAWLKSLPGHPVS
jgi:hypothetical protein